MTLKDEEIFKEASTAEHRVSWIIYYILALMISDNSSKKGKKEEDCFERMKNYWRKTETFSD
jgi:hypothetical protein